MGNYNSQYESYYSTLVNRRRNYRTYQDGPNSKSIFKLEGNFFVKRLFVDLIGVFILFVLIISCKLVVTPQTASVYNYSKEIVNKNYDLKNIPGKIKSINFSDLESSLTDWLENIRTKLTGGLSLKDKIKDSFNLPVQGVIISEFGLPLNDSKLNNGIDIEVKEGENVINPYEGRVKECGEDAEMGKYILIDHGRGIETKYGQLSEILVKKDDKIKQKQVIGKISNTGKTKVPYLHFELIYMGENKNPVDYMAFNDN
jgi:murein DD-endopeptidase MepM/ murein hydrolase activator NlpD